MRYWFRRHLTPLGRWEHREGQRYMRMMREAREAHRSSAAYAKIKACGHKSRRPNPEAIAVSDCNPEICNDCGIGIVHRKVVEHERLQREGDHQ